MLNPFPQLLFLSYFAPTLLRVVAGLVIAALAYHHFKNKETLSSVRFPVVGSGAWIIWLSVVIEVLVAAGLLFGYGTQVAALLGALVALKSIVWSGRYPHYFIFSRMAAFLLLGICLSLMVTGAGALAMDLPL